MQLIPQTVCDALQDRLDLKLGAAFPVGGGMVNQAARVETGDGPVFVKWKTSTPPGFFACEADGLGRLRAHGLRTPGVLGYADQPDVETAFLALEWVEERPSRSKERFRDSFAAHLAGLHRAWVGPQGFGLDRDNFLGSQPQSNTLTPDWPAFYRDQRVSIQLEKAKGAGLVGPSREEKIRRLMERFDAILAHETLQPSLIHGDLWSGNFLAAGDDVVVIDPAVYWADREVEIAFVELFGGFPPGFLRAYHDAFPLDPGYDYRRPLLQLYPLLVHLNHFGETYGPAVDQVCRFYSS